MQICPQLLTLPPIQAESPQVAVYYTNRALCYLKLGLWTKVVEDCRNAIQLEPTLIKAHFFLGQALTELESYGEAIVSLKTGRCTRRCSVVVLL